MTTGKETSSKRIPCSRFNPFKQMVVGILKITLRLTGVHSLKEKRSLLKPLINRLRRSLNISVAETGENDKWQIAELSVACVAKDSAGAHRILEGVLSQLEREHAIQVISSKLEIV